MKKLQKGTLKLRFIHLTTALLLLLSTMPFLAACDKKAPDATTNPEAYDKIMLLTGPCGQEVHKVWAPYEYDDTDTHKIASICGINGELGSCWGPSGSYYNNIFIYPDGTVLQPSQVVVTNQNSKYYEKIMGDDSIDKCDKCFPEL